MSILLKELEGNYQILKNRETVLTLYNTKINIFKNIFYIKRNLLFTLIRYNKNKSKEVTTNRERI